MELVNFDLTQKYPLFTRVTHNYRRIVQRFQSVGINGYIGDGGILSEQDNKQQDNIETMPTRTKTHNHYNKYTIYPLIIYVIDFVMFFENNYRRDYRRDLLSGRDFA